MGGGLQEEKGIVRCVICKHGETGPDKATVTLERDGVTLVIKAVPADVCQNCGEVYVDDRTTGQLLKIAEEQARAGVQVDIREYVAA